MKMGAIHKWNNVCLACSLQQKIIFDDLNLIQTMYSTNGIIDWSSIFRKHKAKPVVFDSKCVEGKEEKKLIHWSEFSIIIIIFNHRMSSLYDDDDDRSTRNTQWNEITAPKRITAVKKKKSKSRIPKSKYDLFLRGEDGWWRKN